MVSIKFFRRIFFVSQCRKTTKVNLLSFNNFGYGKSLDKRVGGSVKIFRRKFLVSQCRGTSWSNPSVLCFKKFPVAKNFLDKRWEYPNFPPKNFGLSAEKRRRDPFSLSLFWSIKKVWMRGWGKSVKIFHRKFLVS